MDILLQKSKIDYSKLRSLIQRTVAKELSNLSEPCYYPSMKKVYYEILHYTGLTDKDVSEFVDRFYRDSKYKDFRLHKDLATNLYIFLMNIFLQKNDKLLFTYTIALLSIRYYSNLMHKMIAYCNKDIFRYSLDNLNKTHLFSREKTIPNALYFLSKEVSKKYERGIKNKDVDNIAKFITEIRHRINQSVKSFAGVYYTAHEEGKSIKTVKEPDEETNAYQYQSQEKESKLVNDITKKITIYKFIDNKAVLDAKQLTKVNSSVSTLISNKLADVKFTNEIKIVIQLFLKDLRKVSDICGKEYFNYVRKLMGIKRTNQTVYFKQQVNVLLLKVLDEMKYRENYNKMTSQTQFLMNLYLAYYMTMVLRNSIC